MHVYIYTYILLLYTIIGPSLLLLLLLLTLWSFLLLSWFGVFVPYYCYWYDFYYSSAYYYHHYHCLYSSLFICLFIVYNIVCLLLLNLIDWYVFIAQCSTIYTYIIYPGFFAYSSIFIRGHVSAKCFLQDALRKRHTLKTPSQFLQFPGIDVRWREGKCQGPQSNWKKLRSLGKIRVV